MNNAYPYLLFDKKPFKNKNTNFILNKALKCAF